LALIAITEDLANQAQSAEQLDEIIRVLVKAQVAMQDFHRPSAEIQCLDDLLAQIQVKKQQGNRGTVSTSCRSFFVELRAFQIGFVLGQSKFINEFTEFSAWIYNWLSSSSMGLP
jgi:hypothetical protein